MQEPSAIKPVKHAPLRGLIREQLLEHIVTGQLSPGARLTEADLAVQLGTSRIPVREALQELAMDGWIDLMPRQGARVHVPTKTEVEEVFALRDALESESARLVAGSASSADVERLRVIVGQGRAFAEAGDEVRASETNTEFHRTIAELTSNGLLLRILGTLEKRSRWYFRQVAAVRGVHSWVEHARIVDAIAAGHQEAAARESRTHTEHTLAAYRNFLAQQESD
jgi:DNA-binding GntR family transcriptional regulator